MVGCTQVPSAHNTDRSVFLIIQAGAQLQYFQLRFHIYVHEEFLGANVRWEHTVFEVTYTGPQRHQLPGSLQFVHIINMVSSEEHHSF